MAKILVFGENPNDTNALRELVLGLCPQLSSADVRILREPPTLQRGAHTGSVRNWVDRAVAAVRAARVVLGDAVCVLAHTDADGPDDGTFAEARTEELRQAGLQNAHAVVPVETIEAWWLLFPHATESVVPSWKGALPRSQRDVDRVSRPKDDLIQRTRKKQPRRPYREGDSPEIARSIVERSELNSPTGSSPSFDRFVETVEECCELAS